MQTIPVTVVSAFETCRHIQQNYGKSYYLATRLFPYEKRVATHVLYAFFRIPDEIVDSTRTTDAELKQRLQQWEEKWKKTYAGTWSGEAVLDAAAWVFHAYAIPFSYSEAFFRAMIQDTEQKTYATYADLESYMYGSAAVVGLMMTHVIGYTDPTAFAFAQKLGEAMQLTNFLRYIREDLEERGRIYLPEEDLQKFGVTHQSILTRQMTPEFKRLLQYEVRRADDLYAEARQGIRLLHADGRFAVRAASDLYQEILRKIEQQGYDVFRQRAQTSLREKLSIAAKAYWKS